MSSSSTSRSRHTSRILAQTSQDAHLHSAFESTSTPSGHASVPSGDGDASISAYLSSLHRSPLIQPFGCLLAIHPLSFSILAFSANSLDLLDLSSLAAVPSLTSPPSPLSLGNSALPLFRPPSSQALLKALRSPENLSLLNPLLLHSRASGKPFYAILHRVNNPHVVIIDLEPVNPQDLPVTAAGALKSYKLAAKSISKLQSLPSLNIPLLCDVLVRQVSELTGYDRVMAYKFHDDEHGEVVAECRRLDLESYLGLHYPATDIPQASRFLFMKNKVRMICDCRAKPVKVIQDEKVLSQPISLVGSTLRAPHGCHAEYMANMGSVASLVMAVTINDDDDDDKDGDGSGWSGGSDLQRVEKGRKLWGLVVCHHTSPRFVPFPLRYACEFLLQVFGIQMNKEVELAVQAKEKQTLRMQTLLCDMLLRDAPIGIFTQNPNVMDLVKCDGAAAYYKNKCWLLGITPTELQIRDIVAWLVECHEGSTGLSTDSLAEVGYPGAFELGDKVCGMAAIKITSKDFIFWFRAHSAKEIKWGGAKNEPVDREEEGRRMHPRSSFKAFLEVVKRRSLPWEDAEMDAIHSLQLILRGSLQNEVVNDESKTSVEAPKDDAKKIRGVDELMTVTNEMVRLIETATVPIWAIDASGSINGWNNKAAELIGLSVREAIGVPLVSLVPDDSAELVKKVLSSALQGKEEKDVEIKLKTFGEKESSRPVILVVNACCSRDVKDNIVGVCFVGQDVTVQKMVMDKYTRIRGDYIAIVTNPNGLIPPIFMTDENGSCSEWNSAMQKLTGLKREEVLDKMLVGEVFCLRGFGCRVKEHDTFTKLKILLNGIIAGQDTDKLLFGFFDINGKYIKALLVANKRTDSEGKITGVLCFLHSASSELQNALKVQKVSEQAASNSLNELSYVRQEIRNSLSGILFTHNLMEASGLTMEQNEIMNKKALCQEQLQKILEDKDLESMEQCYMELDTVEFNLGKILDIIVIQARTLSKERQVELVQDWPDEIRSMSLYGDNLRLQQVLAGFVNCAIQFAPTTKGSVVFRVIPTKEQIGSGVDIVRLEFRIIHPAPGIPEALVQEMFHNSQNASKDGLGLYISQKLVRIMNGTVQYLRDAARSSFIILVKFPLVQNIGNR